MKCPKCGYLGFETGNRCRNCGFDFSLAVERPADPDVPIRSADEPLGPLGDFALADAQEHSQSSLDRRGGRVELDLDRLFGVNPTAADLPLFPDAPETDDQPLITAGSSPRPPLAVRRATPEASRVRPRTPRIAGLDDEPVLALRGERDRSAAEPSSMRVAIDAGGFRRLVAGSIDATLLLTIDFIVVYFTLRLCGLTTAEIGVLPAAPLVAFLAVLDGGYIIAFTAVGGQTIGKMALGLKVVAGDGRPVDVGHATLRALGCLASLLTLGLGFLPAFGAGRRTLHDRLAGTRVTQTSGG